MLYLNTIRRTLPFLVGWFVQLLFEFINLRFLLCVVQIVSMAVSVPGETTSPAEVDNGLNITCVVNNMESLVCQWCPCSRSVAKKYVLQWSLDKTNWNICPKFIEAMVFNNSSQSVEATNNCLRKPKICHGCLWAENSFVLGAKYFMKLSSAEESRDVIKPPENLILFQFDTWSLVRPARVMNLTVTNVTANSFTVTWVPHKLYQNFWSPMLYMVAVRHSNSETPSQRFLQNYWKDEVHPAYNYQQAKSDSTYIVSIRARPLLGGFFSDATEIILRTKSLEDHRRISDTTAAPIVTVSVESIFSRPAFMPGPTAEFYAVLVNNDTANYTIFLENIPKNGANPSISTACFWMQNIKLQWKKSEGQGHQCRISADPNMSLMVQLYSLSSYANYAINNVTYQPAVTIENPINSGWAQIRSNVLEGFLPANLSKIRVIVCEGNELSCEASPQTFTASVYNGIWTVPFPSASFDTSKGFWIGYSDINPPYLPPLSLLCIRDVLSPPESPEVVVDRQHTKLSIQITSLSCPSPMTDSYEIQVCTISGDSCLQSSNQYYNMSLNESTVKTLIVGLDEASEYTLSIVASNHVGSRKIQRIVSVQKIVAATQSLEQMNQNTLISESDFTRGAVSLQEKPEISFQKVVIYCTGGTFAVLLVVLLLAVLREWIVRSVVVSYRVVNVSPV